MPAIADHRPINHRCHDNDQARARSMLETLEAGGITLKAIAPWYAMSDAKGWATHMIFYSRQYPNGITGNDLDAAYSIGGAWRKVQAVYKSRAKFCQSLLVAGLVNGVDGITNRPWLSGELVEGDDGQRLYNIGHATNREAKADAKAKPLSTRDRTRGIALLRLIESCLQCESGNDKPKARQAFNLVLSGLHPLIENVGSTLVVQSRHYCCLQLLSCLVEVLGRHVCFTLRPSLGAMAPATLGSATTVIVRQITSRHDMRVATGYAHTTPVKAYKQVYYPRAFVLVLNELTRGCGHITTDDYTGLLLDNRERIPGVKAEYYLDAHNDLMGDGTGRLTEFKPTDFPCAIRYLVRFPTVEALLADMDS